MRRLIGGKRSDAQTQHKLQDTTSTLDKRNDVLGSKIDKIDAELRKLKKQMSEAKTAQMKERYKQRAASLLKQKKMYMNQQNSLSSQSFSLEQMQFTTEQMKTNMDTVSAMKSAHKTLQKQYKKMNIDKVEKMQDSMFDLMADAEELQDILSRTYDVQDEMDDDELLAELDGLDDEMGMEEGADYLDDLDKLDVPKRKDPTVSERDDDFRELEQELR